MTTPSDVRKAWGAMVLLIIIWGYSWIASKIALAYSSPFTLATQRIGVGVLAMFIVLVCARVSLRPKHFKGALIVGVIQTALFHILNNWALAGGSTSNISILVFTMPFWVVLMAWLWLSEELSAIGWISIGLAGVGLVAMLDFSHPGAAVFSKLIAVACGATWALGAIVVKRLQNRVRLDLLNFSFWQMLLGLIPMLALVWVTDQPPVRWSAPYVASLLFLGIAATALGWWMWFYVLKTLPAGTTGMSSLGVPVIALLGAMIHLGERPTNFEWVGMALILCALSLLSFDALKRNRELLKVPE